MKIRVVRQYAHTFNHADRTITEYFSNKRIEINSSEGVNSFSEGSNTNIAPFLISLLCYVEDMSTQKVISKSKATYMLSEV